MQPILILYSTNAGSTGDVAEAIAAELSQGGRQVDIRQFSEAGSFERYGSIVIGAPMIFGWHAAARRYIRRNRKLLKGKNVAYFACALRLTSDQNEPKMDIAPFIDPGLVSQPEKPGSLNIKERFTTIGHYLTPILGSAPEVKPVSVAFFNGKLDLRHLKWWQVLFVLGVVQGKPGDYRDWDSIRQWVQTIQSLL